MQIEVISCFYQEHFLTPYFFRHYEPWVDKFTIITKQHYENGKSVLDDHVKMAWINEAVGNSKSDWIICVDADEFVYPLPYGSDPRGYLSGVKEKYLIAELARVWTHESDPPLDSSQPPVPQRLHGELPVADYMKPCIFRPGTGTVGIGCHNLHLTLNAPNLLHPVRWAGSHWQMVDKATRNERRMKDRVNRIASKQMEWQVKYLPTEQEIEQGAIDHAHDPVVIQL